MNSKILESHHKKMIRNIIKKDYKNIFFDYHEFDNNCNKIVEKCNIISLNKSALRSANKYIKKYLCENKDINKYCLIIPKKKKGDLSVNLTDLTDTMEIDDKLEKMRETYNYLKEIDYNIIKKNKRIYEPIGSQWVHDVQVDDIIDNNMKRRAAMLNHFLGIEFYDQKTQEWREQRENKITASDVGCVLGENKYENTYKFIIKKVSKLPFAGNMNMYHGNKYETIATMIYQYRMNVRVKEFGLIEHQTHKFLGASPDGIVSEYKYDNIHKTNLVGRMLEIKCPQRRKIITDGEVKDNICPIYYWDQVQLQLECCDLDECDFWQCNILEYDSRDDFINDTDPFEPFRSKEIGFEKGCLIQLLPKDKIVESITNYHDIVYDHAKFVYPEKIEITPNELDEWVVKKLEEIKNKNEYKNYCVDRVIYWKLNNSHCSTIKRDKEWFEKNLVTMKKIWGYVEFFRKYPEKYKILTDYIESLSIKRNDNIMEKISYIFDNNTEKITEIVNETIKNLQKNKDKCEKKTEVFDKNSINYGTYMF